MNAELFRHTYYPYYRKLYRIAFRMLESSQDAEDMVQEVYLKLWNRRNELDAIQVPEAYIVEVTRNLCLNSIRRAEHKRTVAYDSDMQEPESLYTQMEVKDEVELLMDRINLLQDRPKKIVLLKDYEGYSYEEISDMLGMNINHIRVILSRTRKTLRDYFNQKR
ncbi:RNA polymerase sigma-70 factor (ECF subfamily) [Parabacteroides sp. PFB2-12]|uniref:RNA polymerase sigma factor n=1 Tax=unclassified Parabacteroides TaxID=2649774 RepID=UPI0024737C2F|nr:MULTISPECIES: RNA polymerase sigma factor [unclassified Parabacteroides]MDH6341167.1 RNA polymerase sigma-70 factor (ECF subfamily) [Parabacteroides sp. PM6-13]MDH6389357.1 RNA polymerase sigma-70 factor (ECF subfamily) [Parabacteroides sp. PFB2-12]